MKRGMAGRKGDWGGYYIILAIMFVVIGGWIINMAVNSMNTCKMDVPERTTRIKEIVEKVCLDPLPGTSETFVGSSCPSRYEVTAASCSDLTWRMAFRDLRTGFFGKPFGLTWFSPRTGSPPSNPSPHFTTSLTNEQVMNEILDRARELDDPDSILVQTARVVPHGHHLPGTIVSPFTNTYVPEVITNEHLAKIPVSLDKTIVISDMDEDDFTGGMLAAVASAEEMNFIWKNDISRKLVGVYTLIGMQIYGSVTFGPKNSPAASYVIATAPQLTLRRDRAQHLASAYFDYVGKYGTASAKAIAGGANATVWNSADPWQSLVDASNRISSVPCNEPGDFCPMQSYANDLLAGINDALVRMRGLYSSIAAGRADTIALLQARIDSGACGSIASGSERFPTCAAMISCNWIDRTLTERLQKNGCLMSAVNVNGNLEALPLGVMEREAALEVWDINLPESTASKISGEYSYRPAIHCPSIIPGSHLPAWGHEAEKVVAVCMHDKNPECSKDDTCYYCYTIQCANKVSVETEPATAITVKNVEGSGTELRGAIYRIK